MLILGVGILGRVEEVKFGGKGLSGQLEVGAEGKARLQQVFSYQAGDSDFAEEGKVKMYSYPTCFPGQGPQVSLYSNPSSLLLNNTEEYH